MTGGERDPYLGMQGRGHAWQPHMHIPSPRLLNDASRVLNKNPQRSKSLALVIMTGAAPKLVFARPYEICTSTRSISGNILIVVIVTIHNYLGSSSVYRTDKEARTVIFAAAFIPVSYSFHSLWRYCLGRVA